MRSINYRRVFLITWCVITIATTSLCRNVAEADTMLVDANKNNPRRSHRQSKEMKFDADEVDRNNSGHQQTEGVAGEPLTVDDDGGYEDDDTSWSRLLEDWVVR